MKSIILILLVLLNINLYANNEINIDKSKYTNWHNRNNPVVLSKFKFKPVLLNSEQKLEVVLQHSSAQIQYKFDISNHSYSYSYIRDTKPYILTINSTGTSHDYYNVKRAIWKSTRIQKIYSDTTIRYIMSDKFKIYRTYYKGRAIYIIKNLHTFN